MCYGLLALVKLRVGFVFPRDMETTYVASTFYPFHIVPVKIPLMNVNLVLLRLHLSINLPHIAKFLASAKYHNSEISGTYIVSLRLHFVHN